jgi:tripartite-type tricarboxylate transporter receptor subunit TctC
MVSRRRLFTAALLASLPVAPRVLAQSYPDRPLRMIIPFPPGGPVDAGGRIIAMALAEVLGQPVVVDNRGGAGGSVGVEAAAKSQADGLTLVFGSTGALAVNVTLMPNLGYDPRRDLLPISVVMAIPLLMAARAGLPAQNLAAVLAMARARPGALTVGTTGVGSPAHLLAEMLRQRHGIDLLVVHYRGAGPAIVAMLANEVDLTFLDPAVTMPHVRAGKMRGLAISGLGRSAAMPDFPTLVEAGLSGVQMENWYALMVPAATPQDRVARLRVAMSKVLAKPGLLDTFINEGAHVLDLGPQEGAAFIRKEVEIWAEVVRTAHMKPE